MALKYGQLTLLENMVKINVARKDLHSPLQQFERPAIRMHLTPFSLSWDIRGSVEKE
jgi:hypothetical protein